MEPIHPKPVDFNPVGFNTPPLAAEPDGIRKRLKIAEEDWRNRQNDT